MPRRRPHCPTDTSFGGPSTRAFTDGRLLREGVLMMYAPLPRWRALLPTLLGRGQRQHSLRVLTTVVFVTSWWKPMDAPSSCAPTLPLTRSSAAYRRSWCAVDDNTPLRPHSSLLRWPRFWNPGTRLTLVLLPLPSLTPTLSQLGKWGLWPWIMGGTVWNAKQYP
ncbi:hypothetical protein DFH09DRAFT_136584 [Mycena vulgaris]|nr:hypothetical protein DFH09DRAFT_136584 [Mycena vulgaris]